MSQSSASDSDPELDYSDEEIRCSFSRSPTLTDEDDEDIPCFARSNFGLSHDERKELLMCDFIQQQNQDVKLYPGIMHRWLKENHPDILQRLHHFVKGKNHFAFCAPSVLQSLDNRKAHSLPKNMICDVCIFTEHQPTFVLTFRTREGVKDMVGALNAKLSRYIATEIRRVTSRNFSTVYGVVDKQHCLSDQLFDARVEVLINFVNIMAAPSSLRMNYATYRSSAHCFLKMVPEQTSDQTEIHIVNDAFSSTDLTADYIDEGKYIFIERNGYTPCKDRLKTHRSVVIVSPPGEGKTTLGRALLRHFRDVPHEEGTLYQPIILQTPEEWQKQVDKTSPQIIFIDDMFGNCVLSQSKLKQWRDIMPEMIHSLVGGLKLLVMTMRYNIYSDLSATCPLKLFQPDNVVDLWLKRPLLSKDKESLVRIHSQHHDVSVTEDYIKKVATFDKVPGFPLLCKTLMQSVTIGERTFSDMDDVHIEILATEMQNLKDYDLTSFALLVTVVLNGGSINKVKVPPCLTQVCQYLKCAHMEFMSLLHHSKACFEIYLADNGETINISHPNVQQAVARVFSMEMLKHASAKQLSDIFTVTTEDMSQISADWKIRLNSVEEWKELGKRFIVLIQNGDLADVCSHQAFNIKAFIETFFKLQTNKKMSKLLLTQDTEHGLPMLYWSVFTQNSFFSEIIIEKMKIFTKTRMENIMSKFGKAINRTKEIEMLSSSTIASLLAHNMDALENILKTLPEDSKQNVLNMKLDRQTFPTRNKQQGTVNIRGCKTMSELAVRGGCSEALVVLGKFVEDIDDLKMDQHIERAILEGNLNMLQSLLKTISNMGLEEILLSMTRTDDGKEHTFLCLAVQIGNIDIVRELVMCGGDTHLIECCKPLLDICLERNNLRVAQLLLKHDYTTAASDQSMLMPQLCEKNKTAAVKLLLQHGCDVNTRSTTGFTLLQIACLMKYCELLKTLLDYKADVMQVDSDGNTVLHQSVCHSSEDVVAILAKYYQSNHQFLNCRNKDGNTALMIAIKGKEVMIANILLEYDVVVNTVNNNGDTPLHYACGIPSMDIVSVLLSRNADTNISNMQRVTPLHVACDNGELKTIQHKESSLGQRTPRSHHASSISDEIINVLLAKGNTVNVQTVTGDTALHYACRLSRHRAVGALVRADADIKLKNKDGEIPLHLACKIPYSSLISLLVTRPLVDMQNTSGNTPLHLACLHDNTGAVETLLKMEADLNVHNNEHHTPLCIAFWRKSHGALEIILNKYRTTNLKYVMCSTSKNRCAAVWLAYSKADLSDYSDFTLVKEPILHHLCRRSNWEDMELLLTQDISLEMINQCLHLACKLGNVSIIRSLLQHNADPGSRNHHMNTVLHVAVASNSGEAVNALIKGHAVIKYINGQNNSGDTVLHIACRHTNTDIMETLLKAGADANIKNYSDEAAIHVTCKQKDSKPVEILLDKGCDANSLSKGLSPLHIACEYSNLAVVRVLVKHKANVNAQANLTTPLHVAERQKKGDIVCYLIENGANKFAKDVDQHTPLAYRYYVNGHVHITPHVEMLLNKRSDVNCALPDDNTALIHEVKENHLDVVKELIRRGAIIDKHDKEGRSPLLIACYFGFADIVKYLVDKGASIDSPDVEGQTPLYIACDYGHADIAKFLISRGADPNFASKHEKKKTPRHIIERSGNVEIKRLYKLIKLPKVQE